MSKVYDMIKAGHEAALTVCREYTQGDVVISSSDMAIISKYIRLGAIEFVGKKIKVSQGIYFPLIQNEVFSGLTKDTWLKIVRHAMGVYNIESNLSINSVNTYVSSPWKYNLETARLITPMALGGKHSSLYKEEVDAWEQVKEEYNGKHSNQ